MKDKFLLKIASTTRKNKLYRLDKFLRIIHNPDKQNKRPIELVLNLDDYLININTQSYLEWYLFFYGCYEPIIQTIIKKTITPGSIYFDVGANIGIHTMTAAKYTGPTGTVYAFEPHPTIFSRLSQNIALNNFFWINPLNYAVSNKNGSGVLQSFDLDSSNQGMSHLSTSHAEEKVNNTSSFEVKLTSIDTFIEANKITRLDFLKIDVEGHEAAVFQGAEHTIKANKPHIIFENNKNLTQTTQALIEKLTELSYQFYDIQFNCLKKYEPSQNINTLIGSNILAVALKT